MTTGYFDITPYLGPLKGGELILTANSRLRRHILRAYSQYCASEFPQAVQTPRIFSLNQWANHCWGMLQKQSYGPAKLKIVNGLQRQTLWELVIGQSPLASALLQPDALAADADKALTNMMLWQLSEDDVRHDEPFFATESFLNWQNELASQSANTGFLSEANNTFCFLTWLTQFKERLNKKESVTEEQAISIIIEAFERGVITKDSVVNLVGFSEIAPLHKSLIDCSAHTSVVIESKCDSVILQRTELNTADMEIRAAALWSKENLEKNQDAMIGIVVPNLGQSRQQVERIFTEVFEPLAALPNVNRYALPFNFSAGIPLGSTPIIAATIDFLDLNKESWDLDFICNLLLSPFFGNIECELVLRTHLVTALRKLGKFKVSAIDVREQCQKIVARLSGLDDATARAVCEKIADDLLNADDSIDNLNNEHQKDVLLNARLRLLEINRTKLPERNSAAGWSDFFQEHLQLLGWPGVRRLDSHEHQQIAQWNGLLESFQLHARDMSMSYAAAVRMLRSIAGKTPFQAQTKHSPIQILGVLEADGLQFSHCWVMGLHHRQWPASPEPNPLLPMQFQRNHKMPHSSAERELEFATALTNTFSQCASEVIFSSACQEGDFELSPSALIKHIPLTNATEIVSSFVSVSDVNYATVSKTTVSENGESTLEIIDTSKAPAFNFNSEKVRGGASIFKDQSACPFNAFAKHRLGAIAIDEPVIGFSPIDRGNLLHESLAVIWKKLKTQAALIAMTEKDLLDLVSQSTQKAVDRIRIKRTINVGVLYAIIEQERLLKLVMDWLESEKSRPPFKVIAVEQDTTILFDGLQLNLRMDRIDQLENGDLMLIDYKTGEPTIRSWQGERMDDPQLPLYAVTSTGGVAAIAFAQVNAKAMKWLGTGELQVDHQGIAPIIWNEQIKQWSQNLHNIAQGFISGDCRVDMKNQSVARYADDLLPLNRLTEEGAMNRLLNLRQGDQ